MKKQDILLITAHYLLSNSANFKDFYVGEHFFNVSPASGCDFRGDRTRRGHASDIVAETIEQEDFFGDWVPEAPDQATNSNNVRVSPVRFNEPKEIYGREFIERPEGLLVVLPKTIARGYTEILKSRERFLDYAELVDLGEDAAKKIDSLFTA